jgi:hypothetical protein
MRHENRGLWGMNTTERKMIFFFGLKSERWMDWLLGDRNRNIQEREKKTIDAVLLASQTSWPRCSSHLAPPTFALKMPSF